MVIIFSPIPSQPYIHVNRWSNIEVADKQISKTNKQTKTNKKPWTCSQKTWIWILSLSLNSCLNVDKSFSITGSIILRKLKAKDIDLPNIMLVSFWASIFYQLKGNSSFTPYILKGFFFQEKGCSNITCYHITNIIIISSSSFKINFI